jgi:hypothetical protein
MIDSTRCFVNNANAGTMFLIVDKMIRNVTEEISSLVDAAADDGSAQEIRAELDKHDLPEYFRLLNDNVEFLMANNII